MPASLFLLSATKILRHHRQKCAWHWRQIIAAQPPLCCKHVSECTLSRHGVEVAYHENRPAVGAFLGTEEFRKNAAHIVGCWLRLGGSLQRLLHAAFSNSVNVQIIVMLGNSGGNCMHVEMRRAGYTGAHAEQASDCAASGKELLQTCPHLYLFFYGFLDTGPAHAVRGRTGTNKRVIRLEIFEASIAERRSRGMCRGRCKRRSRGRCRGRCSRRRHTEP